VRIFNPAVSIADASQGGLRWGEALSYVLAQFFGAVAGVGVADVMFEEIRFDAGDTLLIRAVCSVVRVAVGSLPLRGGTP